MKRIIAALLLGAGAWMAGPVYAQDAVTPATLKEKGAKLLTKADLEALLPGSTYEDEGDVYFNRYGNKPDGELAVSGIPRMGGGAQNPPWNAVGTWRVSDQGQYCVEFKTRSGGGAKYCMYLWTIGSNYYTTFGRADDAKGRPSKVSK